MRTASHTYEIPRPWPVVAVAAWVIPGLGHILIGHARRGVIAGVAIAAMFVGGLLIGGIDVVDRQRDTLWFAGQAMAGPVALAADALHQRLDGKREAQIEEYARSHNLSRHAGSALHAMLEADAPLAYRTSIGRVNELGTLYCTLAGVMNLLVILDAVGRAINESSAQPRGVDPEAAA